MLKLRGLISAAGFFAFIGILGTCGVVIADGLSVSIENVTTSTSVGTFTGTGAPFGYAVAGSGFYDAFGSTYSVSGTSTTPGRAPASLFSTTEVELTNNSGIAEEVMVTFTTDSSFPFTYPPDGLVGITQSMTTNPTGTFDATGTMEATITGGIAFDQSSAVSSNMTDSVLATKSGDYFISHIYDIDIGAGGSANVSIATRVTPAPEPWTIALAITTFVPVGLLYLGLRRRRNLAHIG